MKNIYNIVPNNHINHITISYRIHKSKNHPQTNTQRNNLVLSRPQRAITYYLRTVTPRNYTDRHENIISYLIISVHT